jgi:RNA polymerase sigma factor (sigma-70 family)
VSQPPSRSGPSFTLDEPERLYRSYGPRCYALARQIVRDAHLAEDVVQEVFATVCNQPQRYDPDRGSVATWLMTITHHKAIDTVRRLQRRVSLDTPDTVLLLLPDPSPGPEAIAGAKDAATPVRAALASLSRTQREVIVLAYYGGYTQSEIAEHLDIPLGTVRSRTLTGMRRLHQQLSTDQQRAS